MDEDIIIVLSEVLDDVNKQLDERRFGKLEREQRYYVVMNKMRLNEEFTVSDLQEITGLDKRKIEKLVYIDRISNRVERIEITPTRYKKIS